MKRLLLLPAIFCLIACSHPKIASSLAEYIEHDYLEIKDKEIVWSDLFSKDDHYYCYIYSEYCTHCEHIKNQVIEKALSIDNLYFIHFQKDIPIFTDITTTIGETDIDKMGILGTPTFIEIENHTVSNHVAGEKEVLNLIEKI